MAKQYTPTNTFQPSIAQLPPSMSMVTSTTPGKWERKPPTVPAKPRVPHLLWSENLEHFFRRNPGGLKLEDLEALFQEEHTNPLMPGLFGFDTLEDLLTAIPQVYIFNGTAFLTWQ